MSSISNDTASLWKSKMEGLRFIQYMFNSLVKERKRGGGGGEREREREINLLVQGIRDVEGPMKNVHLN